MFSPFERMMSFRYLRARKAEGFVSVIAGFSFLGIMLGVATLIIVMSVMNGFRAELVGRILGLNGHLSVYTQGMPLSDYPSLEQRIRSVDGVVSVAPIVEGQVLVSVKGAATGAIVRGFTKDYAQEKPLLSASLIAGDYKNFIGTSLLIGSRMAERFALKIGDQVTLLSPNGKVGPFGTMPRSQSFTVAGVFDVGMFEYNSGFVFMPLEAAQNFFLLGPTQSSILEVMARDPQKLEHIKESIASVTQGEAGVYDWRDSNSSFLNALQVERNVMFLILTLIILVAAFNIISSMIMLVKDKSRDIAIMRTMGAQKGSMIKIFMLTGASVGVAGTVMGAVLGIAFALNIEAIRQFLQNLTGTELFSDEIYFLSKLPAEIDWAEVVVVVTMAFLLSVLATLYPAWRAAKLDPVEALRYE
jgi:lipoprotein-releasing system permease protein